MCACVSVSICFPQQQSPAEYTPPGSETRHALPLPPPQTRRTTVQLWYVSVFLCLFVCRQHDQPGGGGGGGEGGGGGLALLERAQGGLAYPNGVDL